MKQKLVFFIETEGPLSEPQKILMNLSCYMAKHPGFSVDFINNFHQSDLEKSPELFSVFKDINTTDFSLFEGATFITPINYLMHLIVRIKDLKSAKICFFVYDAKAIDWLLYNLKADPKKEITLENLFFKSNSCAFLNYNCISPRFFLTSTNPPKFLPISLDYLDSEPYSAKEIITPNIINLGFIGNLSNAAINSINNLIRNLSVQKLTKPVNIHIIGNVNAIYNFAFRDCSSEISKIIYTGSLTSSQKMEYVQNNIDIAFCVGKNSLEAAQWGIPVVLPVVEEKPFIGNRYVYLFDVTKHIYSWNNVSLLGLDNSCYTLTQVINEIYNCKSKVRLAKQCYEYYKNNNSFSALQTNLMSLISGSSLTLSDCLIDPIISDRLHSFETFNNETSKWFNLFLEHEKNIKNYNANYNVIKGPLVPSKLPDNNTPVLTPTIDKKKKKQFLNIQSSFAKKKG